MSLLEEFENQSTVLTTSSANKNPTLDDDISEILPQQNSTNNESPIFSLSQIGYTPPSNFVILQVITRNNILVMSLSNGHVMRIDVSTAESNIEDIEITRKPEERIHKIFLDPTGKHTLISMETQDNYYLHISSKKPRLIPKMKGVIIDSVTWNRENRDENTTGSILIGTSKGCIFETTIEVKEKSLTDKLVGANKESPFKLVYNFMDNTPITGMQVERFKGVDPPKYFVAVSTPSRLYEFIGGPTVDSVFVSNDQSVPRFQELPSDLRYSELHFFGKYAGGLPKSFAWLTGAGIWHGDLLFGSQNSGERVTTDTDLLPYPTNSTPLASPPTSSLRHQTSSSNSSLQILRLPLSLAHTEFHYLIMYEDKLQAVSTLSHEVVWETTLVNPKEKWGKPRCLSFDQEHNMLWMCTERAVFEIEINKEDRDVWEMYLRKGLFSQSISYCQTPQQKDKVWATQADHYFNEKNYKLAADFYGKTSRGFEEVSLKFLNLQDSEALIAFLNAKLAFYFHPKATKQDQPTQITMIATWLVELYLDRLNMARGMDNVVSAKEDLELFLKQYRMSLDKDTAYKLISSHGRMDILLFYAELIGDYERVINFHIQERKWDPAIQILLKQNSEEMTYKYSPILFFNLPDKMVNAWKRNPNLQAVKLLPALMRYDPKNNPVGKENVNWAITYLSYVVRELKNRDQIIHNYLLSLFAKENDDGPLLQFLLDSTANFDLRYALRLCSKEKKHSACVEIYSQMGLYEEAVELALTVDINLAKEHAQKTDDDSLKKKLWLKIAVHLVKQGDIKQAMELLNHSPLKIEDILPHFPEFTRIGDFKEQICNSLENYNRDISELKTEMDEATNSAEVIRKDIESLRNRYGVIDSSQNCELCSFPLLMKEFYYFPCKHTFHSDCLKEENKKNMDKIQVARVLELSQKISSMEMEIHGTPSNKKKMQEEVGVVVESQMDKLREELDELLASDCPLCGTAMIKLIREPFVKGNELEEKLSWGISSLSRDF